MSSNGSSGKIPVSRLSPNIEKIDEILAKEPESRDWVEDTRPNIHVHVTQPSQPDMDSEPPPGKRHQKKKLAATIIGVILALSGLIQQLQATGWFSSAVKPTPQRAYRQGGE